MNNIHINRKLPNNNVTKTRSPMVCVIILNWNGWQDTVACLDSLAMLDYSNHRVFVVDNGSTNDSIASIQSTHPKILIIETGRNLGFSGGCNVGIRHALEEEGADYIWLLNNDTTVNSQALSAMITAAEADDQIGAIGSVVYYMDCPEKIQAWGGGWISYFTGRAGHNLSGSANKKIHYITGTSILIKRRALETVGLLDEKNFFMYWEDVDFSFRLRRAGFGIGVAEKSIVLHKESSSAGKNSPKLDYYYNESAVRFFKKNIFMPIWPIFVGASGRILKRIIQGNKDRITATIGGTLAGLLHNK